MSIPVTTRAAAGQALTHTQMDTNWTNVARSATTGAEGNIEIATNAETIAFSSAVKAVVPAYLDNAVAQANSNASTKSLIAKGWWRDPATGFTVQWGNETLTQSVPKVIAWPRSSFTPWSIQLTPGAQSVTGFNESWAVYSENTTNFTADSNTGTARYFWFAVGTS
tara:strand:+ start:324 stop:821 length:498 start_codon:yes stop_codon:yes gene_type:complete